MKITIAVINDCLKYEEEREWFEIKKIGLRRIN
ncbi:MAG: hypothetical protein BWY97_00520 [Tenericutes bacterium ADurb.BinA124]|nr:MAG: hypothetical protein BWY97_00520 [Tenericutes bacterium ADurb.BinA124]